MRKCCSITLKLSSTFTDDEAQREPAYRMRTTDTCIDNTDKQKNLYFFYFTERVHCLLFVFFYKWNGCSNFFFKCAQKTFLKHETVCRMLTPTILYLSFDFSTLYDRISFTFPLPFSTSDTSITLLQLVITFGGCK